MLLLKDPNRSNCDSLLLKSVITRYGKTENRDCKNFVSIFPNFLVLLISTIDSCMSFSF